MEVVRRNQTEAERAKEHPPATTTELRTSRSQLRPKTLSVGCHKQTPTDDVPVPLPSRKMRRSSPPTPTCWIPLHQGGRSHSQEAEEDAKKKTSSGSLHHKTVKRTTNLDVIISIKILDPLVLRTLDQSRTITTLNKKYLFKDLFLLYLNTSRTTVARLSFTISHSQSRQDDK